jgi:hypothetical protein
MSTALQPSSSRTGRARADPPCDPRTCPRGRSGAAHWPFGTWGRPSDSRLMCSWRLAGRAAAPGRRAGGPVLGEHGHWTSLIIALPIGFGIAAAAELWHLLRGTGG